MILPDVNVLVHAHNLESPCHEKAVRWWDSCLAGSEAVGLAWVAILGFVRITTHGRILSAPLAPSDVFARLAEWVQLPHVHIPLPSERHFEQLRLNLERLGTAGNMTTDAHLATLAIERGYVLYSTDNDFARFAGLKWKNPCA